MPWLCRAFLFWSVAGLARAKAQKQKWEFAQRTGIHLIEAPHPGIAGGNPGFSASKRKLRTSSARWAGRSSELCPSKSAKTKMGVRTANGHSFD
jgi:hypothetical protein